MAGKRKAIKALQAWEDETRVWATGTARDLALALYRSTPTATRPYGVGVVLDPGETAWSEVPVRFNRDWVGPTVPGQAVPAGAIRPWLVTSARVVGRLGDGHLHGYRWETMYGVRVDLTPRHETLAVDVDGEPSLQWTGAGLAPMAVAAVFHLYGPLAMIEHPGLAPLRGGEDWRHTPPARPHPVTSGPPS